MYVSASQLAPGVPTFVSISTSSGVLSREMPMWRTILFFQLPDSAVVHLSKVSVKCGIYQGDTMSPLLRLLMLQLWLLMMC